MDFTSPASELEFQLQLHPDARTVAHELDVWLQGRGEKGLTITEVVRSDAESESIYLPIGQSLLHRLRTGGKLSGSERSQAMELRRAVEAGARIGKTEREVVAKWARSKFSWHKVACGWDCRDREWSPALRAAVIQWLRQRCPAGRSDSPWELITENHGTGPHFHVARRDFVWRANFRPAVPSARA